MHTADRCTAQAAKDRRTLFRLSGGCSTSDCAGVRVQFVPNAGCRKPGTRRIKREYPTLPPHQLSLSSTFPHQSHTQVDIVKGRLTKTSTLYVCNIAGQTTGERTFDCPTVRSPSVPACDYEGGGQARITIKTGRCYPRK